MRRSFLLFLLVPFVTARSQDPGAAARAAMEKLAWIEGDWVGPAWYQMGPRRSTANQSEKIYRAAGGTVLIIHGLGTAADPGAPPNTVVHDAFAVLSYDAATQKYTLRSHVASGYSMETAAEVGDRKIVWGMDVPGMGKSRYTVTLTPAGEWVEIGERSTDQGVTWTRIMEMTLKKR
jgi:hypothetical protein